jgi:hypothetical protein
MEEAAQSYIAQALSSGRSRPSFLRNERRMVEESRDGGTSR